MMSRKMKLQCHYYGLNLYVIMCIIVLCQLQVLWAKKRDGPEDVKRFINNLEDDGTVTIKWNDGSSYSGGWKDGKKSGEGTYLYADNKIYRGNWLDDMYHGVGVLRTPSGASYNGMWAKGVQEGQGELRYADGSLYFGDFSNNIQHGYGIMKYLDGSSYEGNWKLGIPHGFGVLKDFSGQVNFEGEFVEGLRKDDNNGEAYESTENGDMSIQEENGIRHAGNNIVSDNGNAEL